MNQREIRFRVWVPKRRYSLPEEGIDDTPCMYTWDYHQMEIAWLLSGESNNGWIDPVVMQYIGLKDKNDSGGQEVYEGDIINSDGKIKGNIYEMDAEETDLVIEDFGGRNWCDTYKEAMARGLSHSE